MTVSGRKIWTSRAADADFTIVMAVTDKEKRARGGGASHCGSRQRSSGRSGSCRACCCRIGELEVFRRREEESGCLPRFVDMSLQVSLFFGTPSGSP